MPTPFTLYDPDSGKEIKGSMACFDGGLLFSFEGYGDQCSLDGAGAPLFIDVHQDRLRLIVWSDINQEDATHFIDMEKARESNRNEEEE